MKCAFCKKDFEMPYGMIIVQKDGTPKPFCSSKCRKNSEMGRDNRKVKWILKMVHNKAKAEEDRVARVARQEKISQDVIANNTKKAEKKLAKAERAKAKDSKKKI